VQDQGRSFSSLFTLKVHHPISHTKIMHFDPSPDPFPDSHIGYALIN